MNLLNQALAKFVADHTRATEQTDRTVFIHTFNLKPEQIKKAVTHNLHLLQADSTLTPKLKKTPLFAHKRNKMLCDSLVQADPRHKYIQTPPRKTGCYKCHNGNVCNSLICGEYFTHPHKGNQKRIRQYLNCNTEYCVYIFKCPCALAYVGKTTYKS